MNSNESFDTLLKRALQARRHGDHANGERWAERANEAALAECRTRDRALALTVLAEHRIRLGHHERAIRAALEGLSLLTRADADAAEISELHSLLAMAHLDAKLIRQGVQHATQALAAARAAGNPRAESWALNRVGVAHSSAGDGARARQYLRQSIDMAQAFESTEERFAGYNNLAEVTHDHALRVTDSRERVELLHEAKVAAEVALTIARAGDNVHRVAVALSSLACVLRELGEHAPAREAFEFVRQRAAETGYASLLAQMRVHLADLLARDGRLDEAARAFDSVLADLDDPSVRDSACEAHRIASDVHARLGRFDTALHHYKRHHALEREERDKRSELQSRILINEFELDQARVATERHRVEAQMLRMRAEELGRAANSDALTGLMNRRFLDGELPRVMKQAQEESKPLALALLDLDRFKSVNDRFGHAVGDRVLETIAVMLTDNLRATDLPVRLGGEEFVVVLADSDLSTAQEVCERVRRAVSGHDWSTLQPGLHLTTSVGIAGWNVGESASDWMARADRALYDAKRAGRDCVAVAAMDRIDGATASASPWMRR
jgi:diguanylate cyclase (GGDEF)-like protein